MPFSENVNGAASFQYAHLRLLLQTCPESHIHILVLNYYKTDYFYSTQLEEDFPAGNYTIEVVNLLQYSTNNLKRQSNLLRFNIHAIRYFHSFINNDTIKLVSEVIKKQNPDLIWTEHAIPNYFALFSLTKAPIVYVHHDFLWKLQKVRNSFMAGKKTLINKLLQISEVNQIRENNYIVSGSQSELTQLEYMNPKAITALLPTTYQSIHSIQSNKILPSDIRIVHVGTMSATANKVGLSRFLTICWPELCKLSHPPELWVIGKMDIETIHNLKPLLQQPNIEILGHVDDLSTILRPYDIHIIPYEHDTGTRTRIPLVFNHTQILLSTRNASKGVKGLQNNKNCLLVDTLEEMTTKIKEVLAKPINYLSIADNGKTLFESSYTTTSQQTALLHFLNQINAKA